MNILGDLRRESPRIGNCQCLKVLTIFIPKQGLLSNFHSLCFILIHLQTISVALNIFIGIIFIVFFFFSVKFVFKVTKRNSKMKGEDVIVTKYKC